MGFQLGNIVFVAHPSWLDIEGLGPFIQKWVDDGTTVLSEPMPKTWSAEDLNPSDTWEASSSALRAFSQTPETFF